MKLIALGLAAVMGLAGSALHAQTYPAKPIKIIVAYPAGQGTDIATRYLAQRRGKSRRHPAQQGKRQRGQESARAGNAHKTR